ncbi:MAG: SIR2 family protein [Chitinispirillaceae bacterium]|nr:SIR2 family protein [Chitinispirillaceae bacterium]
MKPVLTKEIAYEALQDFFIENPRPMVIFGTGTSCALDSDFGMPALQKHLTEDVPKECDKKLIIEWNLVERALKQGNDLEKAMNSISSEELINLIVQITAKFIIEKNREYSLPILTESKLWSAGPLFKRLVTGLPETDKCLHVATTNYDLLAEYAFTKAELPYITGFSGGICRKLDTKKAERAVVYFGDCLERKKIYKRPKIEKYIRLYKVHGSINVFQLKGDFVENDEWISLPPSSVKRLLITPGMAKNNQLLKNRIKLLHDFDESVRRHRAFLFLGFGFNDVPIVNDMLQKIKNQGSPGIIITKESNQRIEGLLTESDNLWLVCKNPCDKGSLISNCRYQNKHELPDREIWQFDKFTTEIFGV